MEEDGVLLGLWGEDPGHPGPAQGHTLPVTGVRHQEESSERVKLGQCGLGEVPPAFPASTSRHEHAGTDAVGDVQVRLVRARVLVGGQTPRYGTPFHVVQSGYGEVHKQPGGGDGLEIVLKWPRVVLKRERRIWLLRGQVLHCAAVDLHGGKALVHDGDPLGHEGDPHVHLVTDHDGYVGMLRSLHLSGGSE